MSHFRTEIILPPAKELIEAQSNLLFMGSCFASNIGRFFVDHCFNVQVNPFGVLYNPFSIANSLERMVKNEVFTEADVMVHNGSCHTFFHHSQFNGAEPEMFLHTINDSFQAAVKFLKQTDVLVLTFGTAWVYEHQQLGMIVSNCHKYPSSVFHRFRLTVDAIVERYRQLVDTLRQFNPNVRVIFTVSPVRHWKDGAHGNQLSKATLLLAIEELVSEMEGLSYFPAYELLLDDLRDYRFFADDMLHPSEKAIEYIRDKFIESHFSAAALAFLKQVSKFIQAASHRPFNVASAAHQTFLSHQIEKVSAMQQLYPQLNLSSLLNAFESQRK